ncbi:MAG: DUF5115 domain-containing protein [Prevotella sp.]|nr:DUF5115 domain-containing protein [Prevotella sp.]
MKKHILFGGMLLLAAVFTGCTEDFKDWASPQSNGPEDAITIPGVTATAFAQNVDLAKADEAVRLISVSASSAPEGTIFDKMRIVMTPVGVEDAEPKTLQAISTSDGTFSKETLQEMIVEYFGRRPDVRTFDTQVYLDGIYQGQAAFIDAGTVQLTLIPEAPRISPNYYIVGGRLDWAGSAASKEQKFRHSDLDVYEDPVFSIIIDAADGDTWFAIGDDEGCDAITNNGDWSKLLGIVGGENEATSGSLDYRYNMGADNSFKVPAGAKKIRVTIDMMEQTFKVEAVNIAESYYLIGGNGSWSSDKSQKFTHSDKDVFDDPVFTYVLTGGSELWFAFGDDDAMDAVGEGTWNRLFGTTGASEDLSGSFDRRYNLDGDHSFHVDGSAKYYRFTINVLDMTYEIKPLNFQEYIYEAGCNNGWGDNYQQPLYCTDGEGTYTGFFYAQEDSWTDGKGAFKFRGAAGNWDNGNYGTGAFNANNLTGTLIDDGGSGNIMPEPGFYRADVNLASMTFKLTAIKSVFVVGSAVNNDWDTGVEMTFNKAEHCWECNANFTEAGVIKFKGNGTWDNEDGNWGGSLDNIINGSNDNIPVSLTGKVHIKFFPLCDTKSYAIITPAN